MATMYSPARRSKSMHTRQGSNSTLDTCSSTDEDSAYALSPERRKLKPTKKTSSVRTLTRGFIVKVPLRFVVISLLIAALSTFALGTICSTIILARLKTDSHAIHLSPASVVSRQDHMDLPVPVVDEGKEVPYTTFTSRVLPQEAALTSHTVHLKRNSMRLDLSQEGEDAGEDTPEDNDELHLPAGQHLLVDIKNVDSTFLNSEERLANALVELTKASKLTLLSYHCHSLVPMGVSCAGVLLESHVAVHTWPLAGVMAMDLFTCGSEPLVPLLPLIESLFAIPSLDYGIDSEVSQPKSIWSHKLRGFREGFSPDYNKYENPLAQDLGLDILRKHDLDMKVPLVSEETDFQQVDIYELIDPQFHSLSSHEKSLKDDGSYESLHSEFFRSDKVLFLDGVQQSSLYGDAAYHEALVHPAMIAHENPKRVAIIGGGEGATLREILKHKTVEEVVMCEIDEELVDLCREHLPEWSDCSEFEGSDADSCFDDPRANMVYDDAFQYFIDAFGDDDVKEDKFDAIFMDALDPDRFVAIVGNLYKDNHFINSLYNGLTDDGVFVVQLGESDSLNNPAAEVGKLKDTANMLEALEHAGFKSMHIYDEGHSHFGAPWSYLVCFKDYASRAGWYQSAAEIDLELQQRVYKSKSTGKSTLHYFDASTMLGYQLPSKAQETTYCRREDTPEECEEYLGIDTEIMNIPLSQLEARKSTIPNGGRGLFAAQDIPQGATILMEQAIQNFNVSPLTWAVIENLYEWVDESDDIIPFVRDGLSSLHTFIDGYGYLATLYGKKHYTIDCTISTFCNHGCNGTYIYGDDEIGFTEMNVDVDSPPEGVLNEAKVFSPIFERHMRQILSIGDETLRDIKKDEELFCNYLSFVGDPEDWEGEVLNLRSQCAGETMGSILSYEVESEKEQLSHSIILETGNGVKILPLNHTQDCA